MILELDEATRAELERFSLAFTCERCAQFDPETRRAPAPARLLQRVRARVRGSHAPSLRTIAAKTLREEIRIERGATILCACSGGPDSTAMLHVLSSLRAQLGFEVVAHGVDHGLRAAAAEELDAAEAVATAVGVRFDRTVTSVASGSNLQARAREARYRALREAAQRAAAAYIATAHTADDRAETVLLRLLRGSGARGLAVLPPRDGDLIRPLVRAPRRAVELHVARNQLVVAHDPSNLDTRFARVVVRRELLPLMARLSPRIVETLGRLADELAPERDKVDPLAGLGRRQREQLSAALARTRVRVDDCKEVLLSLSEGGPVLTEVSEPVRRRPRGPERG
jgi:tRNA(Ile)-lysidine synthase